MPLGSIQTGTCKIGMNRVCVTAIGFLVLCCCRDAGEASCWMRPGNEASFTEAWSGMNLRTLTVHDQVDVVWKWDSTQDVSITWTGPENLLDFTSVDWDGDQLIVGHTDRCEWARRLDLVVKAEIVSNSLTAIALRGQGKFIMDSIWRGSTLSVETFASSSTVLLRAEADTLTVKLHAGPSSVRVEGNANVIQAYSSGLGALDASACQSKKAFINQSGVIPLRFVASDYAYVGIHAAGDAIVHGGLPDDFLLEMTSTGELIEQ